MDTTAGPSLYPLHHSKTIHLVRHAQGVHNVEGEKNHDAYLSDDLFDANLTPLGWKQVENLQKHVKAIGLSGKIELVVVSPLL
ncbi:phosphoglycerate mutase-like protein, partial [Trifolium pratense]